jgi:hypothetical protein
MNEALLGTATPGPMTRDQATKILLQDQEPDTNTLAPSTSTDALDSDKNKKLLAKLRAWRRDEVQRQHTNRHQQGLDADFYDGIQWSDEDREVLEERGQAPLTYNLITSPIRWMIGKLVKAKMDWKIVPRTKSDEDMAQVKTKVFKYVNDTARISDAMAEAGKWQIKTGVGWVEVGVNPDPSEPIIMVQARSWRNVWMDSRSTDQEYTRDARYVILERDIDADIARVMFDKRRNLIDSSIGSHYNQAEDDDPNEQLDDVLEGIPSGRYVQGVNWDRIANPRSRVRITECWYKVPQRVRVLRGGPLNGIIFDPQNSMHTMAMASGDSEIAVTYKNRVRYAVWCTAGLLKEQESPYRHNKLPVVPLFAYRRDRDNLPYGPIRGMRDPQEDYNQRKSRALFRLSTLRVMYEEGAFADEEQALEDIARSNGKVKLTKGALAAQRVVINSDADKVQGDFEMMQMNAQFIEQQGGIRNETMNQMKSDMSNVALRTLEDQGNVSTAELHENRLIGYRQVGEQVLSLMEQFMTEEQVIRLTEDKTGKDDYTAINTPQFDDKTGRWQWLNDITATQADFTIINTDFRSSTREALFEEMMGVISKLPGEMGIKLLDIAIDMHPDVPNKAEVISRIRKVAGVAVPNDEMTPEEMQEAQAQAAESKEMSDLAKAELRGKVDKLAAEVTRLRSQGKQLDAQALETIVTAVYTSLQGAQIIATVPQVTPAADQLLQSAGFKDQGGEGLDTSDSPTMPQAGIPMQQAAPNSVAPIPMPRQTDGANAGIRTPANDGVM